MTLKPHQRANGKWRVQYYLYTDSKGKHHLGNKTFDNKMDAELFIEEIYKERKMRKRQDLVFNESYGETLQNLTEQVNAKRDTNRPKPILPRSELKDNDIELPKDVKEELALIDKMSGVDFEKYIINLLKMSGMFYGAEIKDTDIIKDFGVDIIIETMNGIRIAIQCKRLASNVKVDAVQEVFSGLPFYKANYGAVITNAHFTPSAIKLARSTGVFLIDREKLSSIIELEKDRANKLFLGDQWIDFMDYVDSKSLEFVK